MRQSEYFTQPLKKEGTNEMAQTASAPTKADLEEILSEIADLADEGLDPENTREEVVAKLKEIADLASGDDGEDDEEEDDEDEDLD